MKKLAALLGLGAFLLTGAASGQEAASAANAARSFDAVYSVAARGVSGVGEFSFHFAQNGATYETSARRGSAGMARMLLGGQQDYSYSSRGSVAADGSLHPAAYQHRGGKRNRLVQASFSANDISTTANPHMGMGNPPATQAQKRGAIDQLSAIASMVVAQGDPCARTVHVYMDGRSRFDFVMSPNGQVTANEPGYRGPAIRCRVQFQPIAGFSDPQEPAVLTFLFAQTPSGMYAPVRIEMPSDDNGVITLTARTLTVNGQRLR